MTQKPIVTFPTPPYSNPPIEPQYYKPNVFIISAITRGLTTIITTTIDNNYVVSQNVRLLIPNRYGSRGLNEVSGIVISKPANNLVELDISSIGVDPFISNPTFLPFESKTLPQIIAIGDINTGYQSSTGPLIPLVTVPGSFINISPN